MRVKKSILLPVILVIYLAVMAYIGYPAYVSGQTPALQYFGVISLTLLIIVILHFSLRRRERPRSERENDIAANSRNEADTQNDNSSNNSANNTTNQ